MPRSKFYHVKNTRPQQIKEWDLDPHGLALLNAMGRRWAPFHILGLNTCRDKSAAILQTTFWNAFSSENVEIFMKIPPSQISPFLKLTLTISQQLFRYNALAQNRWHVFIWTNDSLVYWHTHASKSASDKLLPCNLTLEQIKRLYDVLRCDLGPLLLTWLNYNHSLDKWLHPL